MVIPANRLNRAFSICISRCCASTGTIMAVQNIYVNAINNFGNDKQKEEFLRPFTDGKQIGSFSLSEPGTYYYNNLGNWTFFEIFLLHHILKSLQKNITIHFKELGSDASAVSTKASKKGSNYIINGTKSWTTNGFESKALVLFASTDKSKKHKGISCFLLKKNFPGN